MRPRLLIRLAPTPDGPLQWVSVDSSGQVGAPGDGALADAAAQAAGCEVVVLVPGTQVMLTGAAVPSRNRQRIAEAIPFVLEEHLIDDVEALHFAIGQRGPDGRVSTVVVARDLMDVWTARLAEAGLRPDVMTPDMLAAPLAEDEWTAVEEDDVTLLRTGYQSGLAFDTYNLAAILPAALESSEGAAPRRIRIITGDPGRSPGLPAAADGPEIAAEPYAEPGLAVLARGYDPRAVVNLLQGPYSRREQMGRLWRPWRPAAVLLIAWLAIQAGATISDYVHLKHEETALRHHIDQTFHAALPDVKHLVNPRVQMQRRLDALRGGGGLQAGFVTGTDMMVSGG